MTAPRFDKLPIGIQDFEKLRTNGFRYVDKTECIYNLISEGTYIFLSRPRRFGKSLLLSTIKAFYEGKRELFEGLAISQHEDVDWAAHPVFHLDLNAEHYDAENVLCSVICRAYEKTGQKAVILVDEYDKPLLEAIGNPDLQLEFRNTLRGTVQ